MMELKCVAYGETLKSSARRKRGEWAKKGSFIRVYEEERRVDCERTKGDMKDRKTST